MRCGVLCLLLAFMPVAAASDQNPLGLSYVETKDLKLIYFEALDHLVPHAVRTFTNSLEWQRRMFDWVPSQSTTVLLKDLADFGNAFAGATPRNRLVFDVAPLSLAFETNAAIERMYALMNHELIHVAQGDVASEEDRRWRRFFLGKVSPQAEHPESLLYSYLTVPRFTAPRWYLEGGAVFMDTWMGGGLGRAQGGYDEMVFRAMVRDGAHFYDPLGLVSRGTRVDFQVGANAYLYGARFFTWLAYVHSPEKVVAWIKRGEGSKRYYADHFQQVFGIPLEQGWRDWIAFEREFQHRNLAEVRKHPITPHRKLVASAVGSISRMYYDEPTARLWIAAADTAFPVAGRFGGEMEIYRAGLLGPPGLLVTSPLPPGAGDRLEYWVLEHGRLEKKWTSGRFDVAITAIHTGDLDGDHRDDVLFAEVRREGKGSTTQLHVMTSRTDVPEFP